MCVCCLTVCIILRRPGESRDPYAVPFVFGTLVDTFRNHKRRWLWVPAFAGTTQEFGPVIPTRLSNPYFLCGEMDCFVEPVIGRAFARPVGSQ